MWVGFDVRGKQEMTFFHDFFFFLSAVGLSFWRHPFPAEDPLVSKRCNATFSKSVLTKKQTHLNFGILSTFSANFNFWVNCSFKVMEKYMLPWIIDHIFYSNQIKFGSKANLFGNVAQNYFGSAVCQGFISNTISAV